jgi:hypothetical protein
MARPDDMTMSTAWVVVLDPDYPDHEYEPCMLWPADAVRELCRVCRGTHTQP